MECAFADRLRNVALVSMTSEIRALDKQRDSRSKETERSSRGGPNLQVLRSRTDLDRKALQDHIASCIRCRGCETNPTL